MRFNSFLRFSSVISFLLICSSAKATGAGIDTESIRAQLGVEYKNFYNEMARKTLVWISPASCDLGKGTKQQFSHMDLIQKAMELSEKIEDESMILDEFKAQRRIIQTYLDQIGDNNSRKIHARVKNEILKPWKFKSIADFDQVIAEREKGIALSKSFLRNVEAVKLNVEERTRNKVDFSTFKTYVETNFPALMGEDFRRATLEEMKAFFG